ncbi:hypothetical protein GCM10010294_19140 [Streptomyces griseoloalbus]|nr:hypothetical protein GCM10010294_19140 [Streptomyces griseoloalbus]
MAADVTLALAPADRERLRKLKDLRKDEEVWEYERQHERNKRRYLGDDVLKSVGTAVVWWLARHENEIEKAVDMIGPLARIAAAANGEEVPELFRHLLVPPVGTRSEATAGGPIWKRIAQGAQPPRAGPLRPGFSSGRWRDGGDAGYTLKRNSTTSPSCMT